MRILYIVYHGFSEYSGITKKIRYQVKGLRENGHDVHLCYYDFAENGHRCRFIDGNIIKDYGMGNWAAFRQRLDFGCIFDYCVRENIEFVYARCFQNANPWLIRFFKKLKKAGIHAVTEIPTYPYDQEFKNHYYLQRWELRIDQLFRYRLYQYMDALVTFSDATEIFGQRTIRISNGVDFDSIPLHQSSAISHQPSVLHLIGVAEVHTWHGYDRLIAGLGEYYKNGGKRDVMFHVVGGVTPHQRYRANEYHPGFQAIIDKYGIADKVVFHGTLFGKELDDVTFHTKQRKITAYFSMKKLMEELPQGQFVRIHKSYIVSAKHVEIVDVASVTVAGVELPIGPAYRESALKELGV